MCAYDPLPEVSQLYPTICTICTYVQLCNSLCNADLHLNAKLFLTYTYAEMIRVTLSIQIQISYLHKTMIWKLGHNHKNRLISDKHLANCHTITLILKRSYKGWSKGNKALKLLFSILSRYKTCSINCLSGLYDNLSQTQLEALVFGSQKPS